MYIFIFLAFVVFIYFWNKKVTFYRDREGKEKVIAEFVKYEWITEKVMRNENHTSSYPFVRINQGEENPTFRLNFKNEVAKSFRKGEKVEVFWCNNELLYWNAYEFGILKFFPRKWYFEKLIL